MFSTPTLKSLEQTAAFTERRHAILAGNVANAGNPGYQSRDLSVDKFQKSLRDAIQADRQEQEMSPGLRLSLLGSTDSATRPSFEDSKKVAVESVRDSMKQIVYHDGSDVDLETQVTQIAKNQSMHTMAIAVMKTQFRQLQMAITGSANV